MYTQTKALKLPTYKRERSWTRVFSFFFHSQKFFSSSASSRSLVGGREFIFHSFSFSSPWFFFIRLSVSLRAINTLRICKIFYHSLVVCFSSSSQVATIFLVNNRTQIDFIMSIIKVINKCLEIKHKKFYSLLISFARHICISNEQNKKKVDKFFLMNVEKKERKLLSRVI